MIIPFVKMQGAGNDYIYVGQTDVASLDLSTLARNLSDRRFGVGSDGLVVISQTTDCDAKMTMFNADGSLGNICGNALRCVGKLVTDRTGKDTAVIKTSVGKRVVYKELNGLFTADMGKYELLPDFIVGKRKYTVVDVGNVHAVTFVDDLNGLNIEKLSKKTRESERFCGNVNVEFVVKGAGGNAEVRVYEKGSGETFSCGSGSVAVAVALQKAGATEKEYVLKFKGGVLKARIDNGKAYLSGEAKKVFCGSMDYD